MLAPTTVQMTGLDIENHAEQPARVAESALEGLGKAAALENERPRRLLVSQTGLAETGELQTYAQAVVDRSAWAITAEGELNTVAYGGLLRAKRPVMVRGAGRQFSGTYYVEKVLHLLSRRRLRAALHPAAQCVRADRRGAIRGRHRAAGLTAEAGHR